MQLPGAPKHRPGFGPFLDFQQFTHVFAIVCPSLTTVSEKDDGPQCAENGERRLADMDRHT